MKRYFQGVGHFFGGVGFIVSTPRMWPVASVPVLVAFGLAIVLTVLGFHELNSLTAKYFASSNAFAGAAMWTVRALGYVLTVLMSELIGAALAQPISGPALDAIARAQGRALGDAPTQTSTPFLVSFGRSLRVTSVTLIIGAPVMVLLSIVSFAFPPAGVVTWPLKLIVAALLAVWDLTDYPFGLTGTGVRVRMQWIRAHFLESLGFGTAVALFALIPLGGLFVLPFGVAGASRLIYREFARP